MRRIVSLACVLLVAGCATTGTNSGQAWRPQIDTKNVDQARYERDLAECTKYATDNPDTDGGKAARKGALRMGLGSAAALGIMTVMTGGLAAVAMLPAIAGGAGMVVGSGAVAGGLSSKMIADGKYQSTVAACLNGRGYKVIG